MPPPGDRWRNRFGRPLRHARATAVVAVVLAAVWLAIVAAGGPPQLASFYEAFGLSQGAVLDGALWQPATYWLLHGSGWHLGLNLIALLLFGGRIEHILGCRTAVAILAGGVIGGAAGHLLLVPGAAEAGVLVGASGGVMAWVLALTTLSPESWMWPLPLSGRSVGRGLLFASALLASCHPALGLPGFSKLGHLAAANGWSGLVTVGHACHLGGGIAGWAAAHWILRPRLITKADLERRRARREARATRNRP